MKKTFIEKLNRLSLNAIDRAITVLSVLFLLLLGLKLLLPHQQQPPQTFPAAFPIPHMVAPSSVALNQGIPEVSPSPDQLRVADGLLVQGSALLKNGDLQQARHLFLRAALCAPGAAKYRQAVERTEKIMAGASRFELIKRDMSSNAFSDAWIAFSGAAVSDPEFFLKYGKEFAVGLMNHGQIASAMAILQTYCSLRPADTDAQKQLSTMQQEWLKLVRQ